MAKINLFTVDKGKITYNNNFTQEELNQINTIGKERIAQEKENKKWKNALNDGYDFGDITKTVIGTTAEVVPRVAKNTFETGKEVISHPIKSGKTLFTSTMYGIDKADDALNNATSDFFRWLLKTEKKEGDLSLKEYNRLIEKGTKEEKQEVLNKIKKSYGENSDEYKFHKRAFNASDNRDELTKKIYDIVNPKYYNTETYKKFENNELSENQQRVWQVGENIGNMLPSMFVSSVAAPIAGSTMFFVQSQQNYTEEAKQRGYDDKKARTYGLIMGSVESGVERLGFDQLGGLGKLAEGNAFKAIGGEALEEFVTPYIDATVRTIAGENVKLSDTIEESITGAVYGGVVGGIMNMGGKGLVAVDRVVNKINTNQQVTSQELNQALEEIKRANPNYFEEIMQDVPEIIRTELNANNNLETNLNETIQNNEQIINNQQNIQEQVNNNTLLEQNNLNQQQIQNKINSLKEELQAYETFTNEETRTKSDIQEITKIQQEIKTLQQQLNQQSNIPTVENIIQQEKNLPTKDLLNNSELGINDRLSNEVDNALNNKSSKSKVYLGKVSQNIAVKIKSLLGIEVTGRKHVLSDNDIRHMLKEHGNQLIESQKGQIAITSNDIKRITEIIETPNEITRGTDNKLGKTIRYIKRYNDNTTYVVEVVPDNSKALLNLDIHVQ